MSLGGKNMQCNKKNFSKELKKFVKMCDENSLEIVRSMIINGSPVLEIRDRSVEKSKTVWLIDVSYGYDVNLHIFSGIGYKDNKHDGLTHLAEHSLFHKVVLGDGRVLHGSEIFSYAQSNGITANAFTTPYGVMISASFVPDELKRIERKDIMFNEYKHMLHKIDRDNVPIAFDILESVMLRGSATKDKFETEKSIVASEITQRRSNNNTVVFDMLCETLRDSYDFSGIPDEILKYKFSDVSNAITTIRRNVTMGTIRLNVRNVLAEHMLRYVKEMLGVLNRNLTVKGMDGKAYYTVSSSRITDHMISKEQVPDIKRRKFTVRKDERVDTNPCVIVYWNTRDFGNMDAVTRSVLALVLTAATMGVRGYLMESFREHHGRCYSISDVNYMTPDKNIDYIKHGFGLWYNLKPEEVDDNGEITPKGLKTIKSEISSVLADIKVSKEFYDIALADLTENILCYFRSDMIGEDKIYMLTKGFLDETVEDKVDKADPSMISYEMFCDYLEHIKNNWTCDIVLKR